MREMAAQSLRGIGWKRQRCGPGERAILAKEIADLLALVRRRSLVEFDRGDQCALGFIAHSGFIERIRELRQSLQEITPEFDRPIGDRPELLIENLDLCPQCLKVHLA